MFSFSKKIRGLTRDANSEKAQAVKQLSDKIEMVACDITNSDDVKRAFKDSWAVFALTDFSTQPDNPEIEIQQGTIMADAAAEFVARVVVNNKTVSIADRLIR